MKFLTTPAFDADVKRLKKHRAAFLAWAREVWVPACDRHAEAQSAPWPAALRVKPVVNAKGIYEVTWSFSGPDGRATFELLTIDGELYCLWRRVGSHEIFKEP